jgi:hypothetical protein
MDPKACIERAQRARAAGDTTEMMSAIADYYEWRAAGGFEPPNGDVLVDTMFDELDPEGVNNEDVQRAIDALENLDSSEN